MKTCVSCGKSKNVRYAGPKCVNCHRKEDAPETLEKIRKYQREMPYTIADRYNKGKSEAKLRKIKWNISKREYYELNGKPCFYCGGALPKAGVGLDRISLDKKLGYSKDNVVPCCSVCNSIRGDKLTVPETLAAVQAVKEERVHSVDNIFDKGYDLSNRILFIFGDISEDSVSNYLKGITLMESINEFATITIKIMSSGGDWYPALALFDKLKNMKCFIVTEGLGLVGSAATILFQTGHKRFLQRNCRFLVHDGEESFEGSSKSLEAWGRESKKSRETLYRIYAQRSHRDVSFWEQKCVKDTIFTAEEAIELGLADKIIGDNNKTP